MNPPKDPLPEARQNSQPRGQRIIDSVIVAMIGTLFREVVRWLF